MVDLKHLTEKGNKRCVIVRDRDKLNIPKPRCCDKNNQCLNQLRRQACKHHWSETLRIFYAKGFNEAIIYMNTVRKDMKGWF